MLIGGDGYGPLPKKKMADAMPKERPLIPTHPDIERVAFAIACVEEHRYRGNYGLWREHWDWFVQSRGLGTCVDYSNQARWAEQAEAVSVLFGKPT